MISHKELLETFEYRDGNLFWRIKPRKGVAIGTRAGYAGANNGQYWIIGFKERTYLAHRLIWFYHTGRWPRDQIDHQDGNPRNNRIQNLRECSDAENKQNLGDRRRSNPYTGVYQRRDCGLYEARITVNKQQHALGYFETPEAARDAYLAAKRIHHSFNPVPR
jgi:hypothetical protein